MKELYYDIDNEIAKNNGEELEDMVREWLEIKKIETKVTIFNIGEYSSLIIFIKNDNINTERVNRLVEMLFHKIGLKYNIY